MPQIPSKAYALSSLRVVCRLSCHDIRSVMLKVHKRSPRRARGGIRVMLQMCCCSVSLLPIRSPSFVKKSTDTGARSSWRVQPRVNHLLLRKANSKVSTQDLSTFSTVGHENVCQIDVAPVRFIVLAKHGVDSLGELIAVGLVDATCVYPEVAQTVPSRLFTAESNLPVARLVCARTNT